MVAAARPVNLARLDTTPLKRGLGKVTDMQREAWEFYDLVPELKHAVWFASQAMSKARLMAAVTDPQRPDLSPVPANESDAPAAVVAAALEELDRVRSPQFALSDLVGRLTMQLEVPGEGYLVMFGGRGDTDEEWLVCSTDEVTVKDRQVVVKVEGVDDRPLVDGVDDCIRVYYQHPRFQNRADSLTLGALSDLRALQLLSQQVVAEASSRIPAGILAVPNELSTGGMDVTKLEAEGQANPVDALTMAIAEALVTPISDPGDARSVVPWVLRGPAEALRELRHISLGRWADSTLDSRIEARVHRLARGLFLPVEVILGHQATTFANASQVDTDTYEDYLFPRCKTLVGALTAGHLRPRLAKRGVPAEWVRRIVVWFDPADMIGRADVQANADAAWDRGTISDAAHRRAKGFTEDDAPGADERLLRIALTRGAVTSDIVAALLAPLADEAGIKIPAAPDMVNERFMGVKDSTKPAVISSAAPTAASALAAAGAVELELRSQLSSACDTAMARALERAGNRLKNRNGPLRATLAKVAPRDVAKVIGFDAVTASATMGELFEGAWDDLEGEWRRKLEAAAAAVLLLLRDWVGAVDAGVFDQGIAASWAQARSELERLAQHLLFTDVAHKPVGEAPVGGARVPVSLVRAAVAVAGGGDGYVLSNSAVVRNAADNRPATGLLDGPTLSRLLLDAGYKFGAMQWYYGPGLRFKPFEPHLALDGTVFTSFADERLTAPAAWNAGFYFPGDHAWCQCSVIPAEMAAAFPQGPPVAA